MIHKKDVIRPREVFVGAQTNMCVLYRNQKNAILMHSYAGCTKINQFSQQVPFQIDSHQNLNTFQNDFLSVIGSISQGQQKRHYCVETS